MNTLQTSYRWIDVQDSPGRNYVYPNPLSSHMKEQYCGPSVYRWIVWNPGIAIKAIYLGETDSLARRVQHCLRPGNKQVTNLRLKDYFTEANAREERVEMQTIEFEPFQIKRQDSPWSWCGIRTYDECLKAWSWFGCKVMLRLEHH